jgi:hypothetical protein
MELEPVISIGSATDLFDFEAAFRAHYARISRLIARIVRDSSQTEDLSAEVFQKLLHTPTAQNAGMAGAVSDCRSSCHLKKLASHSTLRESGSLAELQQTTRALPQQP